MKAVVCRSYGTPDNLKLEDVPTPTPGGDEVLVKVRAASINDWDPGLLEGKPFVNRMINGLSRPKRFPILGCDVAGTVESVGGNIRGLKVGDAVYGDLSGYRWGGFAEYVCAPEHLLATIPGGMTFEEAASLPQAGVLALQGLRDYCKIGPGTKILFNGAGGGAGTVGIQIAKSLGAEITGVDSAMKLETMRKAGADHVVDYTREDFTRRGERYDLILDAKAMRSPFDILPVLTDNGVYVMIGGETVNILQTLFIGYPISIFGSRKFKILFHRPKRENLIQLNTFYESGKLKPFIDSVYPLGETADAFRKYLSQNFCGKIVIKIA